MFVAGVHGRPKWSRMCAIYPGTYASQMILRPNDFARLLWQKKHFDYRVFSKARQRLRYQSLVQPLCRAFKTRLNNFGLMYEVFRFVDASHLITKAYVVQGARCSDQEKFKKNWTTTYGPRQRTTNKHAWVARARGNTGMDTRSTPVWIGKVDWSTSWPSHQRM